MLSVEWPLLSLLWCGQGAMLQAPTCEDERGGLIGGGREIEGDWGDGGGGWEGPERTDEAAWDPGDDDDFRHRSWGEEGGRDGGREEAAESLYTGGSVLEDEEKVGGGGGELGAGGEKQQ